MKALALLSGGLDSTLAIKVILDQGIDVMAINFITPFCQCNRGSGCGHWAGRVAEEFGIEIKVVGMYESYIEVVKNPKHGYGKNLNPCIDCRILMHRTAKEYMEKIGASFIITGEVLGQRPMSQHRRALKIIEKESGLEDLVLRPLSAKLLPPTIPEKEGIVDREKLLAISGRSRKPQMALADTYKIADYPCPAGGCLLTDPGFARRMSDLLKHTEPSINDVVLLKVGRHFRLSPSAKLVVGRNEEENEKLRRLGSVGDTCFTVSDYPGPTGIGRGDFDQDVFLKASQIMARYSDGHPNPEIRIDYCELPDGQVYSVITRPAEDAELQELRV